MSAFKVKSALKRDGAMFKAGDVIEMSDEQEAKMLVEDGVLEEAGKAEAAKAVTPEDKVEEQENAPAESTETPEGEEATDAEVMNYDGMKVPELKAEAEKRGLTVKSGAKKPAIIKMLQKNDEETGEEL